VIYVHGEEIPQGTGYLNKSRVEALMSASALVAVSSFTKNKLVTLGVPADRITVITNGVDTHRFQPGMRCEEIIDRHGLMNRRILLTLARLDERKGQDMLIQALPQIRAAVPDVVYMVVGEGSYENTLRRLVAKLHLEEVVIFTGAVSNEEVADYYRSCDIYAMPNRTTEDGDTEGFGLVFLEAGACGKAVIGGNAGGVPDAIVHEKTGLLVDGNSPEAIAASCIRLLTETELREKFAANGLANARNNDWAIKTKAFLELCNTVILS
jgi:phosphatidylinositol alpha-1,6-mannosyltransferase